MSDSYSQICALDPCGISKKTRSENKRKEKKKGKENKRNVIRARRGTFSINYLARY
jgi:hypothetical protein